ncbi:MAG TPA: hypothetical protein VFA40_08620 [Terriglobales bacterium]|nr:hypothetical protein [Terriglobales bacterium]
MNERMRIWGTLLIITAAVAIGYGFSKELTLEQLKARLQNAKPDDRATLSAQVAEHQVENADKLYAAGKSEEAVAAIHEVVSYSEQAQKAAEQSGKKLKNVEIAVHRMAHRLTEIKRSLPFDDQATVQEAVERLDKIDSDLLNRMFGKNPK